jgi:hypothetical protein
MLAISMCLFACKRDNTSSPDPIPETKEKVPFSFDLTDFIQRTEVMGRKKPGGHTSRDSSLNGITDIYYVIVDGHAQFAGYKHQNIVTDSADFGKIRDTLYASNYTACILASDTTLEISNSAGASDIKLYTYISPSNTLIPFKDLFYKQIAFTLDRATSQSREITLDRAVANLYVEVQDATVNPDYEVSVTLQNENTVTTVFNLAGWGPFTYALLMSRISSTTFSNNIINTLGGKIVTITARNKVTGEQVQKVIDNIVCYKNKRTTLTGSLGIPGIPASTGSVKEFELKVNDNWDPIDNNIGF